MNRWGFGLLILLPLLLFGWKGGWEGEWGVQVPGVTCNWALDFDGNSDWVNCGNNASLSITGAITIEAWVNPEVLNKHYGRIVDKNWQIAYFLGTASSTDTAFAFAVNGTGVGDILNSAFKFSINTWYHLVGVYDGVNMKIYINGDLDTTKAWTTNPEANATDLQIGVSGGFYFNGIIDEVRIYSRALSSTEISWLYNNYCRIYSTDSLKIWLKMEEGSGDTTFDATAYNNDGILGDGTEAEKPAWTEDSPQ